MKPTEHELLSATSNSTHMSYLHHLPVFGGSASDVTGVGLTAGTDVGVDDICLWNADADEDGVDV